ncbi:SDR family NAD(P)-dependent oxidoreductase [Streptomyces sp. NPDC001544]|uniref:SDR family NAD(P)-dependent oxidoreductase n=1 Tax=Streptomyces sp. NPDC001544 TaxID=3364584 RepID=UPI00369C2AC6
MTDAIIIGGGSGMGLALARTLLAEDMKVTIVGRSADRLTTARAELERPGHGKISTFVADMGREEDVAELFAQVERVEHVAVTAADATGVYGRTVDVATATARAIVETKLLGAWLVGKHGPDESPARSPIPRASTRTGRTGRTPSWPRPTARSRRWRTGWRSNWPPCE